MLRCCFAVYHRKKRRAVTVELFGADTADAGHIIEAFGAFFSHFDQGLVVENDIGGAAELFREGASFGLERGQKRRVFLGYHLFDLGAGFRGFDSVAAQINRRFVAQNRAGFWCHAQRAVAFGVGAHQVVAHYLPENRLPLDAGVFFADAKGWQLVVAALRDFFSHVAQQNVDQVASAKAFFGAQCSREGHAHGGRSVEHVGGFVAQITVAAGCGVFAEIGQQILAAAVQGFGEAKQRVQAAMIGGAAFGGGQTFVDLLAAIADVVGAKKREGFGGGTVAPSAADFLVVAFDGFRQVGVGDPADIGLVDAHAERDGGTNDQPVFLLKAAFDIAAIIGVHAAMVVAGGMSSVA